MKTSLHTALLLASFSLTGALLTVSGPALAGEGKGRAPRSDEAAGEGPHRGHPGRHFERMDENQDGRVSREEARKFHAAHFAKMDGNQDGFLTPEELKAAHHERGERGERGEHGERGERGDCDGERGEHGEGHHDRPRRTPEERFARRDENKDGFLSREEVRRMPEERFAQLDQNRDGKLSREEFASGKDLPPPHAAARFRKADADGDGKLSRAEADRMAEERFRDADQNQDGALTREELRDAFHRKDARDKPARGSR